MSGSVVRSPAGQFQHSYIYFTESVLQLKYYSMYTDENKNGSLHVIKL